MTTGDGSVVGAAGRAFSWNLVAIGVAQSVGFGVFLVLADKLSPAAFGVFAIAALAVDVVAAQGRQAVTDHLVQARDSQGRPVAEVFTAALVLALLAWAGLALLAAPLARAIDAPDLALVLPLLGVTMPLAAVQAVLEAGVLQRLAFRDYAARTMGGALAGAGAALVCVVSPFAPAALAVQRIAAALAMIALLYPKAGPTRPALAAPSAQLRSRAPTIMRLWGAHIVNGLLARVTDVIVGARLGLEALGVLRVADRVIDAAHAVVTAPLNVAWAPILSALRDDSAGRARQYLELTSLAALLCAPAFVGLALVSAELGRLLFDDRYAAAASLLPLAALAGLAAPFAHFRAAVLTALGRTRAVLMLTIADFVVTAAAVWIGAGAGLVGAATGALVASVAGAGASLWIVARAIGVSPMAGVSAAAPAFVAAAAMAAPAWVLHAVAPTLTDLVRLTLVAAGGAATYAAVLVLVFPRWTRARVAFVRPPAPAPGEPARA